MKLLLTSGGISNPSLRDALVRLLGKPIAECSALLVPTALYGHPQGTPAGAWRFVNGRSGCPMGELGWKSLGLLELTALPSIGAERWMPWVRATDALLVEGGDAVYLGHWMRQSGLASMLPSLQSTVWVGLSAGSMVMTPRVGDEFVEMQPSITGSDATLGVVPFSIFPHLDHAGFEQNTMACAERWAARIGGPAYAIDDQTGIQVVDGRTEVISEGNWRYFAGQAAA
jgi:dipeptidase E